MVYRLFNGGVLVRVCMIVRMRYRSNEVALKEQKTGDTKRRNKKQLARFSRNQLREVAEAERIAKDVTGDYYALTDISPDVLPVDIRTLLSLRPEEVVSNALAHLVVLQKRPADAIHPKDIYRIALQDHNILAFLARHKGAMKLLPLAIYILTHELIHVVRFAKHIRLYSACSDERLAEEAIVHALTCKLLSRLKIKGMKDVTDYYGRLQQQLLAAIGEKR